MSIHGVAYGPRICSGAGSLNTLGQEARQLAGQGAPVLLVADAVNRLTLSHLVLPGGRPDQVAADIARLVDALLPGSPSA